MSVEVPSRSCFAGMFREGNENLLGISAQSSIGWSSLDAKIQEIEADYLREESRSAHIRDSGMSSDGARWRVSSATAHVSRGVEAEDAPSEGGIFESLVKNEGTVVKFVTPRFHFFEAFVVGQTACWYELIFSVFWLLGTVLSLFQSDTAKIYAKKYVIAAVTSFLSSVSALAGVVIPSWGKSMHDKMNEKITEWSGTAARVDRSWGGRMTTPGTGGFRNAVNTVMRQSAHRRIEERLASTRPY